MSAYIGQITFQAFADANANYLKCEGQNVSRTTYAELFAIVGTTYGVGDGSTTFGLPDLQGRIPLGAGSGAGLTVRALGAEGGQEAITDVPLHSHAINADSTGETVDPTGKYPATSLDENGGDVNSYGSLADINMAPDMVEPFGADSVNVMNPFVVVQAVICYQITVPTGNYRYLEDLTATTALDDVDIMYVTKSPATTPLSRKITWAYIKTALKSLFNSYHVVSDLGTNATTVSANSARELDVLAGLYNENRTLTFSDVTNLRRCAIQITNTNANVITFAGITVKFVASELPSGMSFASNALTFPADTAVVYNIVLEKFNGTTFRGRIELDG